MLHSVTVQFCGASCKATLIDARGVSRRLGGYPRHKLYVDPRQGCWLTHLYRAKVVVQMRS